MLEFTVTRVPTTVTNKDLTAPESGDSDFSPAQSDLTSCNWLDGVPGVPVLSHSSPNCPDTKCNPLIAGKNFGLLQSPLNGHFEYEVLRVARANPKTHAVSVGPALVTFGDGADARSTAAAANGWIWLYVPEGKGSRHTPVFLDNWSACAEVSNPTNEYADYGANDDGLFLGWSNQGGPPGAVYFVPVGSNRAQLLQSTKEFVFLMQASTRSMTVVEAQEAKGPFVAYRFKQLQN